MMVHERSVPIPKGHGLLPNGQKVDFGNSVKTQKRRSSNNQKKDKKSPQSLGEGFKPEGKYPDRREKNTSKSDKMTEDRKKNKKKDDAYAGTTFHTSPEALNLPKPTFKSSPKLNNPVTSYPSPYHNPVAAPLPMQHQVPQHPMQPPQYQTTPQGAPINMPHMPHIPIPMMGMPMMHQSMGFPQTYTQQYPTYPIQANQHPQHMYQGPAPGYNGQKVSFNDLLGSTK